LLHGTFLMNIPQWPRSLARKKWLYVPRKRAILARVAVKKSRSESTTRPTRRRVVQYVLIFVGCVLVVNALVGDKGLFAMLRAREQHHELETALAKARATNAALRDEARRYREDLDAIEGLARSEHGMIKDGEKVFIIRDVLPPDVSPRR
jgi:cell division protein FtsB